MTEDRRGMNNRPVSRGMQVLGWIFGAVVILMVCFFIWGQFFTKSVSAFAGNCVEYKEEWKTEAGGFLQQGVVFPANIANPSRQESMAFTTVLPEGIRDGIYLCFLTDQTTIIYVDGIMRYTFDGSINPVPGGFVKSHYIMVPLYQSDVGATLRMVQSTGSAKMVPFNAVFMGDKVGIRDHFVKQDGLQWALACILALFSLMVIIIGFLMNLIYKHKISVVMLAYGTLASALWFIFDSFLYQIRMDNFYVDGPMEYMLVLIFPYFFVQYMNYEQERRYEKAYTVLASLILSSFVLISIMHFSGILSYRDNLIWVGAMIMVDIVCMQITIIIDFLKGFASRYSIVAIGFELMLILSVVQVVVFNVFVDYHGALFLVIAVFVVLLAGTFHTIRNIMIEEEHAQYAKHANELKSSFLANMSHEIRTPINAISGMNEMVIRETGENHVREYAANIRGACNNLLDIINDILDFSRIESGRMELYNERYSLSGLVKDVENVISIRAEGKNLSFETHVTENLPEFLEGDELRIRQIMLNLLNNSVKYTETGGIVFRVELGSKIPDPDQILLHIEVEDTGIGIREEDMGRLFKTFERLEHRRNKGIEGTGLGLSITHNLVEMMGGQISVRSEYGKGTTFFVDIPQTRLEDEKIGDMRERIRNSLVEATDYKELFVAPQAKVLVVDDVALNLMVVKGLLKKTEVQVVEASSGPQCIEICKNEQFDVILMDHMMPEMDGIEALEILRQENLCSCPVIALTANAIDGMREMYLENGFSDYLSKPVQPTELEEILAKYIPSEKVVMR